VDEVAAKVIRIIAGHLGIDPGVVLPDASLVDDLGADSLDTVELVIAFEAAFALEIAQDDVERIRTVQDAISYIETHQKAGQEKA
jgi:acyl carrier protein